MKKIIVVLLLLIQIKVYGISAQSAILMDTDNNIILYEKNVNEVRSVASISKIMTAILAIESGRMDDKVTIGNEIDKAYGSGIYIRKGEQLTLRDLVYGLMLRSGNDAALAIANYVGGSVDNFVLLMNDKAKEIGMKSTTFNNPSGLDEDKGNYSTAYDMAKLASYAIKNDEFKKITGTKKYKLKTTMNTYIWNNKNKMLSLYKYSTGGKTGYTETAKRTLVSYASKDNTNLVVVTLNDGNDWNDHKYLFEYGFNNYKNYTILKKGKINIYNESYYKRYTLYVNNDYNYLFSKNVTSSLTLKYKLIKSRNVNNGDTVGNVYIYLGDREIHKEPIYAYVKDK
jgi:D-alanyl-D-alanine carboxypeptidase